MDKIVVLEVESTYAFDMVKGKDVVVGGVATLSYKDGELIMYNANGTIVGAIKRDQYNCYWKR